MKEYEFEIQNCIKVNMKGASREEARIKLIESLKNYADEMLDGNCYVSDGEEV